MERASEQAEEAGRLFLEIGAAPEAADAFQLAADASTSAGDEERARELVARARSLD